MTSEILKCGDCGQAEGLFHAFGCELEECPLCHGKLSNCACVHEFFGLLGNSKLPELSEDQLDTWLIHLEKVGRLPVMEPKSEGKWEGYGTSPALALIEICKRAAEDLEPLQPGDELMTSSPMKMKGFLEFHLRLYPPLKGRHPVTNQIYHLAPSYQLSAAIRNEFLTALKARSPIDHQESSLVTSYSDRVDFSHLERELQKCRAELLAGKERVILTEIGFFQRGFVHRGLEKDPTLHFEIYSDFNERLSRALPSLTRNS